jgi:hypothetical protein
VVLEAGQFVAFKHVQGRQAGELLEVFAVFIDGCGGHKQREATALAAGLEP